MKNDVYITPSKLTIIGIDRIKQHKVHYLVYKITFKTNKFYYIGQHKTKNPFDNYTGSGVLVKSYKKKYGISNMIKEILFDFDNYTEMDNAEHKLVPVDINGCNDSLCLNLMEGGHSCQQTSAAKEHLSKLWKEKDQAEKQRIKDIIVQKNIDFWANKSDDELNEWKDFCRQKNIGENNPMYGVALSSCMDKSKYDELIQKNTVRFKQLAKQLGKKRKGKSLEEIYGEEKARQIKEKIKATKALKQKL